MPRRRASIAASISAVAAGGALRYRASSSGAPARNWITSPSSAPHRPPAPSARLPRPASWPICAGVKRGGHGDVVPGQQLPRLGVPVVPVGCGRAVRVSQNRGPHGGQHQHRGPAGVAQQLPQPGGDPLAQPGLGRVEVELGLVQPHHGPRPDARQLAQRRIGAGRVDRMPQPPRPGLVPQQVPGPPSRPGSCRWRTRRPAPRSRCGPARPRATIPAQRRIVLALQVRRQVPAAQRRSSGWTGRCTSRANGSVTSASGTPTGVAIWAVTHRSRARRPRHPDPSGRPGPAR